jgi:hypothetical protein
MNEGFKLLALAALIIGIIVLGPLMLIWSVNTLFPVVNIPYTFETWVAAAIIPSLFRVSIAKKG